MLLSYKKPYLQNLKKKIIVLTTGLYFKSFSNLSSDTLFLGKGTIMFHFLLYAKHVHVLSL